MHHPFRLTAIVAAALLLGLTPSTRAQDQKPKVPKPAIAHTWSGDGSGSVAERKTTKSYNMAGGSYELVAEAKGPYSHAKAEFAAKKSLSCNASALAKTCYQIDLEPDPAYQYRWKASGDMDYSGKAAVGAGDGYSARLSVFAGLAYTGDLSLAGAANLAVHTDTEYETEHTMGMDPSITLKVKRKSAHETDETKGVLTDARSGPGTKVRVDVTASAAAGFSGGGASATTGAGDGKGEATNAGKVVLEIFGKPIEETTGGGATSAGGDPGTNPPQPRWYAVEIVPAVEPLVPGGITDRTGHPRPLPGSHPVEPGGSPDEPKNPTHKLERLVGTDDDGNYWYVIDTPADAE